MNRKDKLIIIILGAYVVFALILLYVYSPFSPSSQADSLSITTVENVFVDLDGDGDIDLLVEGDVIFNSPPLETPPNP